MEPLNAKLRDQLRKLEKSESNNLIKIAHTEACHIGTLFFSWP